jgi:hypothetical protein
VLDSANVLPELQLTVMRDVLRKDSQAYNALHERTASGSVRQAGVQWHSGKSEQYYSGVKLPNRDRP